MTSRPYYCFRVQEVRSFVSASSNNMGKAKTDVGSRLPSADGRRFVDAESPALVDADGSPWTNADSSLLFDAGRMPLADADDLPLVDDVSPPLDDFNGQPLVDGDDSAAGLAAALSRHPKFRIRTPLRESSDTGTSAEIKVSGLEIPYHLKFDH
jgi:hypothetical protein